MFGELLTSGVVTPDMGRVNFERLLTFSVQSALQGWVISTLGLGWLESDLPDVGKLGEIIRTQLGMGRLIPRAMAPLLDVLCIEPLRQDISRRWLPNIPSEADAARLLNRHAITDAEYVDIMARHGWGADLAAELRMLRGQLPSVSELRGLLDLQQIDEEDVPAYLEALGFPYPMSGMMARLVVDDRVRSYLSEGVTLARAMFEARELGDDEFRDLLKRCGLSEDEITALFGVAEVGRSRPRRLDRSTVESAYVDGVIDLDRLESWYAQQGYAAPDVEVLEALVVRKKADAEAKAAAAAKKVPPPGGLPAPISVVREAFRRGLVPEALLLDALNRAGYSAEGAGTYLAVARSDQQAYAAALARKLAPPAAARVTVGAVEELYVRGMMSEDELSAWYDERGYSASDRDLLLELRGAERTEYEAKRARTAVAAMAPTVPKSS
jgi:hypothetical protein